MGTRCAGRGAALAGVGLGACVLGLAGLGGSGGPEHDAPAPVARAIDFNRDIRPILSNNCFACHGPDERARQGNLRLDERAGAIAERGRGHPGITPGDPDASAVLRRVRATDPDVRMPPPEVSDGLGEAEIALLEAWIAQGAPWADHWAFTPIERPAVETPEHPVDALVDRRLRAEGLAPAPPADARTLVRRVTLDLTGLPPTRDEVEAFLADERPDAYERVVDRLLASPRYGEHMARYWLDAARYGDTHGLHLDNHRDIWPYRDWVIRAFNDNMPFDQFTVEQLAGDLLPAPTTAQRVATGFSRNNVTTSEGGAIDAEYLVEYAADRTETMSTVFLGLTVSCARCHDHKFDPISQTEYFRLFAYFNNVAENAMDGNAKDPPPVVRVPSTDQQRELDRLESLIAGLSARLDAPNAEIDDAERRWRDATRASWTEGWRVVEVDRAESSNGSTLEILDDRSVLAGGDNPDTDVYTLAADLEGVDNRALRLEALTHESLPASGPGRAPNANLVLTELEAEVVSKTDPDRRRALAFVAAGADHEQRNGRYFARRAIDGDVSDGNGWAVEGFARREDRVAVFVADEPFGFPEGARIRVTLRFESQFPQHAIGRARLAVASDPALSEPLAPLTATDWHALGPFVFDDARSAYDRPAGPERTPGRIDFDEPSDGVRWVARPEFVDGRVHGLSESVSSTYLARTITAPAARTVELSLGSDDGIKVWLNGRLVHEHDVARAVQPDQDRVVVDLDAGENLLLMKVANSGFGSGFAFTINDDTPSGWVRTASLLAAADLTDEQDTEIRRTFRSTHAPETRRLYQERDTQEREHAQLVAQVPTTLVMREREERRPTHVLDRGAYDRPTDPVEPGVPAALHALADGAPPTRLGLARWLVDPANPLTARVTVNRLWQQLFGTGLVRTSADFGSQGELPSHPALLDWLGAEFVASGWDVKHVLRRIVTSRTYQRSSALTPELLERDPGNRLLARASRFRLDAETIRDQALLASGLLDERLGGPSVRPVQPPGVWEAVAYPDSNTRVFEAGPPGEQHRRSLYTYWKRTSPPPNLTTFDAPSREYCTVRRPRTNTPLQALVLLNDPQFVEAARALAQASMGAGDAGAWIADAFVRLTAREPTGAERRALLELYDRQVAFYQDNPGGARALLAIGTAPRDESIDPARHAAMTTVACTLLALDEVVTRN